MPKIRFTRKPICAYCGNAYGSPILKEERSFCQADPACPNEPPMAPPYQGNGLVYKETYNISDADWKTGTRAYQKPGQNYSYIFKGGGILREALETQTKSISKYTREQAEESLTLLKTPPGRTLTREIWIPGEYRTPYGVFCKLRCALNFASSAHTAGYRIKLS